MMHADCIRTGDTVGGRRWEIPDGSNFARRLGEAALMAAAGTGFLAVAALGIGPWLLDRYVREAEALECLALTVVVLAGMIDGRATGQHELSAGNYVCPAVFAVLPAAIIVYAVVIGRRRAVITADGTRVTAVVRGPFGRRARQWRRQELADVRVAASPLSVRTREDGATVRQERLAELHIVPAKGPIFRLPTGRDRCDLERIAEALRTRLKAGE
jgi:hypothetical protein